MDFLSKHLRQPLTNLKANPIAHSFAPSENTLIFTPKMKQIPRCRTILLGLRTAPLRTDILTPTRALFAGTRYWGFLYDEDYQKISECYTASLLVSLGNLRDNKMLIKALNLS